MKKIVLAIVMVLAFSFSSFAQSEKVKETATEKVEELNAEIVAGDSSLALTEKQREQIFNLQVERILETRKLRKDGAEKEAIKEVNQKYFKKIHQEILTKEQRKARQKAKKE